ncbi:MAG: FAD-binding oxidoreductase [Pseudomonadales bacterium]|nr:FAD-binding oxidoreductase [Pseudomonadales bacterium]
MGLQVETESTLLQSHGSDWTRFYAPAPLGVVFPRTTEDVLQIVRIAREHNIALVPSGGRTGLSGGAVAKSGELVVSFDRMNQILDFNPTDRYVTVQPGVITATLQEFAEQQGYFYPVDFASSGSSQIGGNISTNAGGIKVLRYGLTRDWIAGLKVVTGTGELLELNKGLVKNATGYDLRHLMIGAEGTLGFIVEATIRLAARPRELNVILLAVPEMGAIMNLLAAFREKLQLTAYEFFSENALQHVLQHSGGRHPFHDSAPWYALLEFESLTETDTDQAMEVFEVCLEEGWCLDGVISASEAQRQELWSYRERISESITPHTPYKNDVAVRVSRVPEFLAAVDAEVNARYPDYEIVWFGHIGDGNLHLNILKPATLDTGVFKAECEKVSEYVLAIVEQYEGSVSAEHGVGLIKRDQLHFSRSPAELAFMRAIKQVFDPDNIMNPGKVIAMDNPL